MDINSVNSAINSVYGQIGQANSQREVINRIIVSIREQLRNYRGIKKNIKLSFSVDDEEFGSEELSGIETDLSGAITALSSILGEISTNVSNYYSRLSDLRREKAELEAQTE